MRDCPGGRANRWIVADPLINTSTGSPLDRIAARSATRP
jgi:hypothetical protein